MFAVNLLARIAGRASSMRTPSLQFSNEQPSTSKRDSPSIKRPVPSGPKNLHALIVPRLEFDLTAKRRVARVRKKSPRIIAPSA